jgi:[ribosomal protein S18]-alanine N-acetyltransferase
MQLRPYNPDDFDELYSVEERCFEMPLRFDREYMLELLTRPGSIAFVVEEQRSIVAFAIASLHTKTNLCIAYIETIEVLAEFRSRGLARKLLAQLEASAEAQRASKILLHVDCLNEIAVRLYETSGYSKVKERVHFYPNGNTAFVYQKSLL